MSKSSSPVRTATAFAAGGVFALGGIVGMTPATAASGGGGGECGYAASVVTSTQLTLDRTRVQVGQSNTAHATVSAGSGTPTGTVTFRVAGHAATVELSGTSASYSMPTDLRAGRTYEVTARYNGAKCFRPSSDTASVAVESQAVAPSPGPGGPGGGGGPVPPAAAPMVGAHLPSVGSDEGLLLYGAGGLVLLGAGGIVLGRHRRRSHA